MGRSVGQEIVDLRGIKHWELNFPYMLHRASFKLEHFGVIVQGLAYQRMVHGTTDFYINGKKFTEFYYKGDLLDTISKIPLDCMVEIKLKE